MIVEALRKQSFDGVKPKVEVGYDCFELEAFLVFFNKKIKPFLNY